MTILILFVWGLIVLCVFILLASIKIYKKLKHFEDVCIKGKNKFLHDFIPLINNSSTYNKNLRTILNIDKIPKKTLIYPILSSIFKAGSFFQGLKFSFALTKKLLR